MKHYYATYATISNEIAIFNSKEERDDWVNHKDWFSVTIAKDDEDFLSDERIPLSAKEAYWLIGKQLYNAKEYDEDGFLDNVMWAARKPSKAWRCKNA